MKYFKLDIYNTFTATKISDKQMNFKCQIIVATQATKDSQKTVHILPTQDFTDSFFSKMTNQVCHVVLEWFKCKGHEISFFDQTDLSL